MVAPDPVAFSIFGFDVRWYGVLIGLAILIACTIVYLRAPRFGFNQEKLLDVLIISIPVGVIGARAYYVAFNWERYAGDFGKIIDIRGGGLAIHGGLIFGILCAAVLCRIWKIRIPAALDLAAPSIAVAQSIGRWGNFFNEEAHGGPTDFPIHVLIDGQAYHATFLYESVWCFLLFLFLLLFSKKRSLTDRFFFYMQCCIRWSVFCRGTAYRQPDDRSLAAGAGTELCSDYFCDCIILRALAP